MRWIALGMLVATIAAPLHAQEVQRYVNRAGRTQAVTPDRRLPVENAPLIDPNAALDSIEAHQTSQGVSLTSPAVFYSVSVTLSVGQGPGRVMVWDRLTVPADGPLTVADRPMRCFYVDAGDRTTVFSSAAGIGMKNGVAWAFSSSGDCQTKTAVTANFIAISLKATTR